MDGAIENQEPARKPVKAVWKPILEVAKWVKGTFWDMEPNVPLVEINDQLVAEVIRSQIWAEGARLGDRTDKEFSATTLLDQITPAQLSRSLGQEREYLLKRDRIEKILLNWSNAGIVEMEKVNPDADKETIKYRIINQEAVKRLSEEPQVVMPI